MISFSHLCVILHHNIKLTDIKQSNVVQCVFQLTDFQQSYVQPEVGKPRSSKAGSRNSWMGMLYRIAQFCMNLYDNAWYCMEFHSIAWYQGGITCGAIDEPRKSSKAIDERVIINFRDKNVVIAFLRQKWGFY